MDEPRSIELCLYRDGEPLSAAAFYHVTYWTPGTQQAVTLYPLGGGTPTWSVRFVCGHELAPHWRTLLVEVLDENGLPIATARPALLYTRPWAVPTVIAFPHRWDGDRGPFVLTMRVDGGIARRDRFDGIEDRHDDSTAGAVTAFGAGGS